MNEQDRKDHVTIDETTPAEPTASKPIRLSRGEDEGVPIVETFAPVEEKAPFWNPFGKKGIARRPKISKPKRVKRDKPEGKTEVPSGVKAIVAPEGKETKSVVTEGCAREVEIILDDGKKPKRPRMPRKRKKPKLSRFNRRVVTAVLGVLILLMLIAALFFRGPKLGKGRTLAVEKSVYCATEEMESVKYSSQGLRFWDRQNLAFYNTSGEEEALLEKPDLGRVFYLGNEIYAINHLTQDATVFDQTGEQIGYISGGGFNVLAVGESREYRVMHRRTPDGELLSLMKDHKELQPLFSTGEFILTYDVQKPDDFIVATMVTRDQGYRSRIVRMEGDTVRNYDFDNEVVMKVFLKGNDIYAITNQNLYWLRNEDRHAVPITLFKNAVWDGNRLWVLHGDVLESFNRQLKLQSKVIPALSAVSFMRDDGINYVYSATEIAGYGDREDTPSLYYRTGFTIRELQTAGDIIAIIYGDHVDLTRVVAADKDVKAANEAPAESEETAPEKEVPSETEAMPKGDSVAPETEGEGDQGEE